jgi:hypothetical protein
VQAGGGTLHLPVLVSIFRGQVCEGVQVLLLCFKLCFSRCLTLLFGKQRLFPFKDLDLVSKVERVPRLLVQEVMTPGCGTRTCIIAAHNLGRLNFVPVSVCSPTAPLVRLRQLPAHGFAGGGRQSHMHYLSCYTRTRFKPCPSIFETLNILFHPIACSPGRATTHNARTSQSQTGTGG